MYVPPFPRTDSIGRCTNENACGLRRFVREFLNERSCQIVRNAAVEKLSDSLSAESCWSDLLEFPRIAARGRKKADRRQT
jgi:hypothetical protein